MTSPAAIDPRSISSLRGRFKRNIVEWLLPLAGLGILVSVPVWVLFFAPNKSAPLVINMMVFGLLPGLTLWGGYMCTTSYDFDGENITCRRLGSLTIWQHTVSSIEAVELGPGMLAAAQGSLNYFYVRWPDRRRWVILTSDLRHALRQLHNNV